MSACGITRWWIANACVGFHTLPEHGPDRIAYWDQWKVLEKDSFVRDNWIAANYCRFVSVDGQQSRCHTKYRGDTTEDRFEY